MTPYNHILVTTDFSKQCSAAAQRARQLASELETGITLLHVVNYIPPSYVAIELPAKTLTTEFILEKAQSRMDEWADENGLSDCDKTITIGHPKHAILDHAREIGVDLVVMAPNMESKFVHLFGSVTNAVSQSANCDVLIVR